MCVCVCVCVCILNNFCVELEAIVVYIVKLTSMKWCVLSSKKKKKWWVQLYCCIFVRRLCSAHWILRLVVSNFFWDETFMSSWQNVVLIFDYNACPTVDSSPNPTLVSNTSGSVGIFYVWFFCFYLTECGITQVAFNLYWIISFTI